MRLILLATLVAITGCADLSKYDRNSPAFQQCRYEAEVATPPTRNAFEDVARKMDLIDLCMQRRRG